MFHGKNADEKNVFDISTDGMSHLDGFWIIYKLYIQSECLTWKQHVELSQSGTCVCVSNIKCVRLSVWVYFVQVF